MRISPATPHGWLLLCLRTRVERARATPERGVSTIEWVIITAVLVALAAAVGLAIYNMVDTAAEDLEIPDAPGGN